MALSAEIDRRCDTGRFNVTEQRGNEWAAPKLKICALSSMFAPTLRARRVVARWGEDKRKVIESPARCPRVHRAEMFRAVSKPWKINGRRGKSASQSCRHGEHSAAVCVRNSARASLNADRAMVACLCGACPTCAKQSAG